MPPIIIGHSFGGLYTQLLLDRGLGSVGVALDPAPIAGVLAGPRALLSALPILTSIGGWNKVLTMSFRSFANTFGQTLPTAEKRPFYDRNIIPTPGRIFYQAAFGREARMDRKNPNRAPLLLVVADKDRTVTPGMVRATYRKQRRAPSKTEFMTFPRRSHLLFAEPGFEEVADRVLAWALENRRSGAAVGKR